MSHNSDHHDPETVLLEENKRFYTFINIAFFLAVLTGIELLIIYVPFPTWIIWAVLIGLSLVKFFCVILWFMHLIYDHRFLTLLFMAGLLIATFTYIAMMFIMQADRVDWDAIGASLQRISHFSHV